MKSIKGKISVALALLATLYVAGTTGVKEAVAAEQEATPISATVWIARTVDQVKVDLDKMVDNTYTIVRGDTLSVLGQATGIPFEDIAKRNGIADPDWIYEGNKLIFDRDRKSVTIQDESGETVAQIAASKPKEDNADSTKPAGGGSTGENGSGDSSKPTTPPTTDNGSGSGDNGTTTPPTGGDNGQSTDREVSVTVVGENAMFTRFRVGPFNNTDEASAWVKENYPNGIKGYEVHPDGDYIYIEFEIAKDDQVTPPGDGDNGSGGEDNGSGGGDNGSGGGETTPPGGGDNGSGGGDNGSGGGDNGSGGGETNPEQPTNLGNSGIFVATQEAAFAEAYALWAEGKFLEFTDFVAYPALNAAGDIIGWTVNFY